MPEPVAPKTDKEVLAKVVQVTVRVAAAILVSALVEVILVVVILMVQVSLGERYASIKTFFPLLAALAGVPLLTVLKGPVLFFTALFYAVAMYALLWYFQSALLILWGALSVTGG